MISYFHCIVAVSSENMPLNMHKKNLHKMCRIRLSSACHAQIIIQAFALHSYILYYPMLADCEEPYQAAQMGRLLWLGLGCLHMPEDMFSHGTTHLMYRVGIYFLQYTGSLCP